MPCFKGILSSIFKTRHLNKIFYPLLWDRIISILINESSIKSADLGHNTRLLHKNRQKDTFFRDPELVSSSVVVIKC